MLQIGNQAPDLELDGSHRQKYHLSGRQNKYAVLVFYPKNNTPG